MASTPALAPSAGTVAATARARRRLEARGVTVEFGTGSSRNVANDGLDFHVDSGEIVGLVGGSGSGKSTLGRVLAGFQRPTRGEVWLDGDLISSPTTRFARASHARIQMVFQDPYSSLNPSQRAWQAVAEVLRVWHGTSRSAARRAALELLAEVGIGASEADRHPKGLSGGQRQRVSVARALALEPGFLIADEPTASLDQSIQAQLLVLFERIQRERGLGLVLISHDLRVVRYLTSRMYVMQTGRFVEVGDTEAIYAHPRHDYTRELTEAIPGRSSR